MPRYTYDPVTQRYTLLPEAPVYFMAPSGGIASLATPFYGVGGGSMGSDGGDASASGPSSSGTGSGGIVGDLGLGLSGYGQTGVAPGAMAANLMGPVLSDLAISQQANVMSQLADANAQANEATVTQGPLGPAVSTAVGISPVAPPATPTISEISPTQALASMNAESQAESQSTPVAALASSIASAISAAEDAAASTSESGAPGSAASGVSAPPPASDAPPPPASDAPPPPADGNGGGDAAPPPASDAPPPPPADGDGGSSGEREGGIIKRYQYGGGVMSGMGDSSPRYSYAPLMMAEGGLAAAHRARSMGRGQDTMLVHMTPGEVRGLQALAMAHGGSLTINPDTGLPEAGFLQRILPMVLGAGLSLIPGVGPLMAAGLVGAGYGVAKGSLKEGLMAGLGAYGGAGLAGGLGAAGATTAEGMAAEEAARQAALQAPVSTLPKAAQDVLAMTGEGVTGATTLANAGATASGLAPSTIAAQQGFGGQLAQVARGPEALLTEQGRSAFMGPQGMGAAPYSGIASTVAGLSAISPEPAKPGEAPKSETHYRPYEFKWNPQTGVYNPSPRPGDSSERLYFDPMYTALPIQRAANGGVMGLARGGNAFDDESGNDDPYAFAPGGKVKPRSLKGEPYYKFSQDRRDSSMEASVEQNFARGGLGAAKKALPPRFLDGAGDGMSDSIKANIDGVQEARLADGEFVVPADVVSHLGNGSSKAGAKKLYAMMDKIRKARTGSKRQAPEVNAQKYMPA